jgi:2-methylcitrate dehydratase
MTDTIVERLVAYAHNLRFEDLPPETVHQAKRLVADSIGCGLAASRADPVVAARDVATGISVRSPATILGTRTTTTPDLAAFVNGTMVRYLDFNDSYNGKDIAHPSDNLAAVMAAGEAAGASGRNVITAFVLAYEVQAAWVDSFLLASGGAWDQAAYAAISAPLGAGKVMGLTGEELAEPMSDEDIEDKFRRLTHGLLTTRQQDQSLQLIWHLDDARGLKELMELLVVR